MVDGTLGAVADLVDDLSPVQRAAVENEATALCILAGAGSGKTRVLTRRIAWRVASGSASAGHVLALTFTRRAAGELSSRLAQLGIRHQLAAGTFHSIAYAQLRRRWADRGEPAPALLERKGRLLAPLLPRSSSSSLQPADLAAEIEWAKARMVRPSEYEAEVARAGRRTPLPPAALASLYDRYEHDKRKRGLVDFDDLLWLCADAMVSDPQFAAAQRWRFRHLFVDEFQDVNRLQFRVLRLWAGDSPDLCVVGDPNQAIYAWNGADSSYLSEFGRHFPGAAVCRLDDNWRSSPQVVAVANAVASELGPVSGPGLLPHAADGPVPTVASYGTDREEAEAVARALRRRHGSAAPWSSFAVLTRTHAQLVLFEEALRAAAIPFRVRGQSSFLHQPEVRQALTDLRRRPAGNPLADALPDLVELARVASVESTVERAGHLDALARLAREHLAADAAATTADFVDWLSATLGPDQPDGQIDAVELATLHAAKGLEWPVVFLAGLEHGLLPIGHADTPEARAEERRLLYVGVTRARRELHCSWAERRTFGLRTASRSASPFLNAIEAVISGLNRQEPAVDWRRMVHEGRQRLAAAAAAAGAAAAAAGNGPGQAGRRRTGSGPRPSGAVDGAMFDALKEWRAGIAKASGVPAYVVFHDTTLAALADAKPRDQASLLAVPGIGPVKVERYGDGLLRVLGAKATSLAGTHQEAS